MEKISNQKSHSYIDRIGKVNPIRIRQDKGRHWRHPITMSNSVARFVRRWVADYCATMDGDERSLFQSRQRIGQTEYQVENPQIIFNCHWTAEGPWFAMLGS